MISKTAHKKHSKLIESAIDLSSQSNFPRAKIGAILVVGKTILSTGYNQRKTHPLQKERNVLRDSTKRGECVHAEVSAISRFRELPKNAVLYIGRKKRDGTHGMARPCGGCMSVIKDKGIRTIVYTTGDGIAVEHID